MQLRTLVIIVGLILIPVMNTLAQPDNLCKRGYCSPGGSNFVTDAGADGVKFQYLLAGRLIEGMSKPREDVDINGVFMSSTHTIWAVGSEGKVFRKAPDSKKWKNVSIPDDLTLGLVRCLDDQICWVAGNRGNPWKTIDGGLHWVEESSLPTTSGVYSDIIFLDAKTGWIFDTDGTVFRTTDGGRSWVLSDLNNENGSIRLVNDAVFVSKKVGFVCGLGGISKTVDGGKTWKYIFTEKNEKNPNFDGIAASGDGMRIWAFGGQGLGVKYEGTTEIHFRMTHPGFYSNDGGKSWTKINDL